MTSYLRYKQQIRIVQDADDDIESWITVRGNHIPIKKGQSKEEAVKSFIESKGEKEKGGDYVSAGREKAKREAGHEFKKRSGVGIKFTEYDPEFEVVRKNALANGNVYGGKYTQKSKAEAYKEYKNDTSSKENMKKANEFVNGKPESSVKLSKGMTLKFSDGSKQTIKSIRSDLVDTEKSTHTAEKLIAGIKKGDIKIETKESSKSESKPDKAYNTEGLYQDALNELDDQIADKEKELENIHLSMTENAEGGYFDIASANMEDIEFVKGQLNELKKKREKLVGSQQSEKPKSSNKTTFYKNVSGKQLWSPAWKGSGRKSGYTAIENQLLTEKEMEKHGFNKESSAFQKMELGKKDHHYFFGARFETKKGNK